MVPRADGSRSLGKRRTEPRHASLEKRGEPRRQNRHCLQKRGELCPPAPKEDAGHFRQKQVAGSNRERFFTKEKNTAEVSSVKEEEGQMGATEK